LNNVLRMSALYLLIKQKKSQSGQALIEYLLIFGLLGLVTVAMVQNLSEFMGNTTGRLGFVLTQHLSSGTCQNICAGNSFINKTE